VLRQTRVVTARLALAAASALVLATSAHGAVRVVAPFPPERYADEGAIGLVVPGAGATVTRASALNALLTGRVRSSYLGGTQPGPPLLRLDVGPPPDTLLALPPPGRTENDRRYPIAVVGGGASGLLTSDSTRIDGLVSITDIAAGRVRWVAHDDPVHALDVLDRRIERNDRLRLALTVALIAVAAVVALVRPRYGPRVFLLALAGNLWLAGWWVVAALAAAALLLPLGAACAALVGGYLLALGLDPESVALSPLGPSQAGRFYGFNNLLETAFLVPALLGPMLLGRRGVLLAAAALVAVGGSRFGADGGGLLVLLAGYATLVVRVHRIRVTPARALAGVAVLTLAGVLLVALDAALGGSSHVTSAVGGGPGEIAGDVWRRWRLSWARSTDSLGPLAASAAGLAALVVIALRRPRLPLTDALLAALAVSVLVNDTPSDVLAVGAAAALAIRRWEAERLLADRPNDPVRLRAMRRTPVAAVLVAAALALVAVGCESPEEASPTPETVEGTLTTPTQECTVPSCDLKGDPAKGKDIFAAKGCGGCHTLAAAGSSGTVGPNLDDAKPSFELAVTRVTNGQGAMPSFKGQLSAQEIADVAQYVVQSTSG
jgi:mono/diheme cytochrome c family protein